MKKTVCTLMVILLLASVAGTAMGETQEYSYLAVLTRYTKYETANDLEDYGKIDVSLLDLTRLDLTRVVTAYLFATASPIPLLLPEGSDWEEPLDRIGVRVTFDQPFEVILDRNSLEIVQIPVGILLQPKRVEVVGSVEYGVIAGIGDDYVVLDARDQNANPTGILTRYTITPDTLMWYESDPFEVGSGCEMIVSPEGVALTMQEGNG